MKPLEGAFVVCADREGELGGVRDVLAHRGCRVLAAESVDQLRWIVQSVPVNLVVARVSRGSQCFLEMLAEKKICQELPPVIVVTDRLDVDLYLDAMSRGAFDCVPLPIDEKELERIAARALRSATGPGTSAWPGIKMAV